MFDVYLTTLTLEIDVGQGAARTLSADIYVNTQVNGSPTCLLETCNARMRGSIFYPKMSNTQVPTGNPEGVIWRRNIKADDIS